MVQTLRFRWKWQPRQQLSPSAKTVCHVALEASFFPYERATTLSAQGWHNKAKGVISECLEIRKQYAQGQLVLAQAPRQWDKT